MWGLLYCFRCALVKQVDGVRCLYSDSVLRRHNTPKSSISLYSLSPSSPFFLFILSLSLSFFLTLTLCLPIPLTHTHTLDRPVPRPPENDPCCPHVHIDARVHTHYNQAPDVNPVRGGGGTFAHSKCTIHRHTSLLVCSFFTYCNQNSLA